MRLHRKIWYKNKINFDKIAKNKTKQNKNQTKKQILIISGSGSGKTNDLLNLIKHQPNIDTVFLCANKQKVTYEFLICKREQINLKRIFWKKTQKFEGTCLTYEFLISKRGQINLKKIFWKKPQKF